VAANCSSRVTAFWWSAADGGSGVELVFSVSALGVAGTGCSCVDGRVDGEVPMGMALTGSSS
jgi:hypothetical protein